MHRFIEDRRLRFALLGSSARKLKAAGVNLLAGRALRKVMHPLTPAELGGDFALDGALDTGTIPLVWVSEDRRAVLESYVQLYLREEIRAEALVRNLPGFARFLPVAALYHGEVVNVSGLARDCGVARSTVQGYLDILEDTLLAFRLPAFEARLRVRERRHPKLYWVDPGLVRAVKRLRGPIAPEERGALLEGWVLHLLRAHGEESDLYEEIRYWAPHPANRTEVDFLLRRGGEFAAIEVKSQPRYHTGMLPGLRAVADLPGVVRRVLVYGGRRSFRTQDGVEVWSVARLHRAGHVLALSHPLAPALLRDGPLGTRAFTPRQAGDERASGGEGGHARSPPRLRGGPVAPDATVPAARVAPDPGEAGRRGDQAATGSPLVSRP